MKVTIKHTIVVPWLPANIGCYIDDDSEAVWFHCIQVQFSFHSHIDNNMDSFSRASHSKVNNISSNISFLIMLHLPTNIVNLMLAGCQIRQPQLQYQLQFLQNHILNVSSLNTQLHILTVFFTIHLSKVSSWLLTLDRWKQ